MISRYFILNVLLATLATAAADQEAPIFTYCPNNIIKEDTLLEARIFWQKPSATDNSGAPPAICCSKENGGIFPVPSSTDVFCKATDQAGNVGVCSFKITLKKKPCPQYPAPKNGALSCFAFGSDLLCIPMCKNPLDFAFNPPWLYYCNSGQWNFYGLPSSSYEAKTPWPDCTARRKKSWPKMQGYNNFFFDGDANDPNVQDVIRTKFISLAQSVLVPPFFCKTIPECTQTNVQVTVGAIQDEPPVFTSCPKDIIMDDLTDAEVRVTWKRPEAADESGLAPTISCSLASGHVFAVPGVYEVFCKAIDATGNEATCNFRITLKKKSCPLYPPPKNGALACNKIGTDRSCVVMCQNGFDFVFNPPILYYCRNGQWQFYSLPNFPYNSKLPWPDCSNTANPSYFKLLNLPGYLFSGDANDPKVQDAIKTNYITVTKGPFVPPLFCRDKPAECNPNTVEVYAGAKA